MTIVVGYNLKSEELTNINPVHHIVHVDGVDSWQEAISFVYHEIGHRDIVRCFALIKGGKK